MVRNKPATGRTKDLADAEALEEIRAASRGVDLLAPPAGDHAKVADDLMQRLLDSGWESKRPRVTADPNVIAIDARKRPYLLRASVTAPATDAGGTCKAKSEVEIDYFVPKNDASFAR